jgi:putative flavoprotein involved in K+ transport
VELTDETLTARTVIVATGAAMAPRVPDIEVTVPALHASEYRNPGQLPDGPVLVAGAGNSGAEIALDLAPTHRVLLAGRPTGRFPMTIGGAVYRAMDRLLTADTRLGRRIAAGSSGKGTPLVRVRERDLRAAGVTRLPPVTEDVPGVASIVWATGYRADYSWIDLPGIPDDAPPPHERGVVAGHPGLFFVGLPFQYSMSSSLVAGVGRDAAYVAARAVEHAVRV